MQTGKLKIGFDLDDTIANHSSARQQLLSQFPKEKIERGSFTREEIDTFQETLYGTALGLEATMMQDARDILRSLAHAGEELYIISRRMTPHSREFAEAWIAQHVLEIPREHVFFVDDDVAKGGLCKKLGISLFLDNREAVLKHLSYETTGVLFDPEERYPNTTFHKVKNWQEFWQFYQTFKDFRQN